MDLMVYYVSHKQEEECTQRELGPVLQPCCYRSLHGEYSKAKQEKVMLFSSSLSPFPDCFDASFT